MHLPNKSNAIEFKADNHVIMEHKFRMAGLPIVVFKLATDFYVHQYPYNLSAILSKKGHIYIIKM